MPLFLLLCGGIVLTLGDFVMKEWVQSHRGWVFGAGLLVYLIGEAFLAYDFKFQNIAVASTIMVIINVVALSLLSWFFFKETLNGMQVAGILLGIAAVVILELA